MRVHNAKEYDVSALIQFVIFVLLSLARIISIQLKNQNDTPRRIQLI